MSVNFKRPLLSRRSIIAAAPGLAVSAAWGNRARAQSTDSGLPDAADGWGQATTAAAPPLAFSDVDGNKLTLKAYHGHILVVNLWATWCGPCTDELPTFAALEPRIKSLGGLVLPISIDLTGAEVVRPFYARAKITNLPILLDPQGHNLDVLNADGVPITLIIDRQGKLAARVDGAADWNTPRVLAFLHELAQGHNGAGGAMPV
ncbi:MAG: TlpA disulfide reductase family protein [Acidocella sp.]|nr:TlpA disulfide reductase family protein [Acidocella sp.]